MAILQTGPLVVDPYHLDATAGRFTSLGIPALSLTAAQPGSVLQEGAGPDGPAGDAALAAVMHLADLIQQLSFGMDHISSALHSSGDAYRQSDISVSNRMKS